MALGKNNDNIWRQLVNSLPELKDGAVAPSLEKIDKASAPTSVDHENVIMYKLTTTTYVYQHIGSDIWFGANTLQDVEILGDMTLDQARQIVNAKRLRRRKR